ncbi:hypothetical protein [Persicobacter sp. CCB-QB2]|uniref:hypothetical protein n=1 Tax=Persicobacter sp. CCB-QB2 TaxID=1561025 RepID=UPI0006A9D62A|nr:hypothetical protein [Persicobacter sp. CCB-QB2]
MEDNLIYIIYIVLAILWAIFKPKKKKKQEELPFEDEYPPSGSEAQNPNEPPLSFEEILAQLSGQPVKKQEQEQILEEEEELPVRTYSSPFREEAQPEAESLSPAYEVKQPADEPLSETRKSSESLMKSVENADKERLGAFRMPKKKKSASKYGKRLRSKGGLKDAVIMAEIINRKY